MSIFITILLVFLVIVSVLLVLVVLMQRPKSEGLGASFGGGFTEKAFGAGTTDVLQRFTTWMGVLFFGLAALLAYLYSHQNRGQTAVGRALLNAPVPATASPAPTAASAPVPAVPGASPEASASPAPVPDASPAAVIPPVPTTPGLLPATETAGTPAPSPSPAMTPEASPDASPR